MKHQTKLITEQTSKQKPTMKTRKQSLYQHPRLNGFNERWTGSWFVIAAGALALTAQSAFGLAPFVSRIPNGSIASCSTCHTSGFGFNPFGQSFKNNKWTWNATLAGLDSDGDGLTNGQELGDPNGTGTPTPGAWVSNPGDPHSNPAPPGPPCTIIKNFGNLTRVTGSNPQASLVQGPDGTLYGTAGYADGYGTVYKIQPDGRGFAVLKCFTNSGEGAQPFGGLVLSGGTLYGTTYYGGSSDKGTVFKVNADGTGYAVLKNFTYSAAALPRAGLVLSGGTLYGTTYYGGSSNAGTVFKVNIDGTGYTVLKNFTGSDGSLPQARLVLSGGTLYGTTYSGGSSDKGTVFKVNTNGTGYTVLKSVTGSPQAGLVLSGSTLYGMMGGTVFKVNTNGTGYTELQIFPGSSYAGLVLSGSTLYGTTYSGGSSNAGTVFKVNTDGTGYTVLKNFTGSDGGYPQAGLILSGGTLYGTTRLGGSSDNGTVFKVNTDGTGYTVLKNFTGIGYGAWPQADLVLSGGTLYGTTWNTACDQTLDDGTVFKVNTDGTGFTKLKSFTGNGDGSGPSDLVLSGGTLYGTTLNGGNFNIGTVFRIDLSGGMTPVIDSQPQSQVNLVGTTSRFSVTAIGTAPLTCQWRKNGVNLAEGVQSSGATISGTTTTDLTIANVQMSDAGDYTVVVTNTYGSVTSSVAALTVQLPTPIVLTPDCSGSSISNGFAFNLSGMAGQTVVIEASTNLTSWTPLLTNSLLTGHFYFNDPDSTNCAQRFYRARLTP